MTGSGAACSLEASAAETTGGSSGWGDAATGAWSERVATSTDAFAATFTAAAFICTEKRVRENQGGRNGRVNSYLA